MRESELIKRGAEVWDTATGFQGEILNRYLYKEKIILCIDGMVKNISEKRLYQSVEEFEKQFN